MQRGAWAGSPGPPFASNAADAPTAASQHHEDSKDRKAAKQGLERRWRSVAPTARQWTAILVAVVLGCACLAFLSSRVVDHGQRLAPPKALTELEAAIQRNSEQQQELEKQLVARRQRWDAAKSELERAAAAVLRLAREAAHARDQLRWHQEGRGGAAAASEPQLQQAVVTAEGTLAKAKGDEARAQSLQTAAEQKVTELQQQLASVAAAAAGFQRQQAEEQALQRSQHTAAAELLDGELQHDVSAGRQGIDSLARGGLGAGTEEDQLSQAGQLQHASKIGEDRKAGAQSVQQFAERHTDDDSAADLQHLSQQMLQRQEREAGEDGGASAAGGDAYADDALAGADQQGGEGQEDQGLGSQAQELGLEGDEAADDPQLQAWLNGLRQVGDQRGSALRDHQEADLQHDPDADAADAAGWDSAGMKEGAQGIAAAGAGERAGQGASSSSGAAARQEEADDSVRCRLSHICEGASACDAGGGGTKLGCVTAANERQEHIREAARWTWKGYKEGAWGQDELLPVSRTGSAWFNLGLTLVDGLDTLLLMGLRAEYDEARDWVAHHLQLDQDTDVNLFETTIRVLGGLLAAFHLAAGDRLMLYRAVNLGLRLSPGFVSPSGIPWSDVNLGTHATHAPQWSEDSSLSETTSLSLEFSYLARATGRPAFEDTAVRVVQRVAAMEGRRAGLAPIWVNPRTGRFNGDVFTLGARGDSYYEYLLKHWLLSGKQAAPFLRGYKEAMRGVRDLLLARTGPPGAGLLYVAELHSQRQFHKMDHLVCFLPGLLALGHLHGVNSGREGEPDDLALATDLMATCYQLYRRTPAGLAPEIAFFTPYQEGQAYPKQHTDDVGGGDFTIKQQDSHNLLRPETVESLFVMWRVTREARYRDWGWHIFRAFQAHTRVDTGGYTNLNSVLQVPPPRRDKMESFWLAETLKYLFLLFDDSQPELLPLDQYVFNTEAHPLPIAGSAADAALARHYLARPDPPPASLPQGADLVAELQAWEAEEAQAVEEGSAAGGQAGARRSGRQRSRREGDPGTASSHAA